MPKVRSTPPSPWLSRLDLRRVGSGEVAHRVGQLARRFLVAQHHDHAVAGVDDALHRRAQRPGPRHAVQAEQIAQRVGEVHAHQRRFRSVEPAVRERQMHLEAHVVLVGVQAELAELGLHALLGDALHRALGAQPMADQVGDGADLEPVAPRELLQLRAARHAAVVVHHLAQHAGRLQPGELAQVDRRLGVAGAHQHAAAPRAQRKDMAGAGKVARCRGRLGQRADGGGAVGGRHAGGGAGAQVHRNREGRAMRLAVDGHHLRQLEAVELLFRHGHADDAAGVADHERHALRRGVLGRHDEVALVLAVLVVHDHDHAPGTQLGDDLRDRTELGSRPRSGALAGNGNDLGHGVRAAGWARQYTRGLVAPAARAPLAPYFGAAGGNSGTTTCVRVCSVTALPASSRARTVPVRSMIQVIGTASGGPKPLALALAASAAG